MSLGRLSTAEVEQLAVFVVDRPLDDTVLRTVHERAEGNPLLVVELVRLAAAGGRGSLPAGIREVIAERLDHLPAGARGLVRKAAVLGREFPVGLLTEVVGEDAARLAECLDVAMAADVMVADGQTMRFTHALTQEVAYAELPLAER